MARAARRALSREDAVAYLRGDDPRPLLVLRECKVCNGTDDALLKGAGNEMTYLLSRWFHCVKLPVDVLEEDHPFHLLFLQEKPEHLFVMTSDGSVQDPLESQTSRTELWDSMRRIMVLEYSRKPDEALKDIQNSLNKLDVVDGRLQELRDNLEETLIDEGPKSRKLPKLRKKIAEAEADKRELQERIDKATKIPLKRPAVAPEESAESEKEPVQSEAARSETAKRKN